MAAISERFSLGLFHDPSGEHRQLFIFARDIIFSKKKHPIFHRRTIAYLTSLTELSTTMLSCEMVGVYKISVIFGDFWEFVDFSGFLGFRHSP